MRRAVAISLMMLFSWTLIAPLVAVDAEANHHTCCCGKGKCHCRMCSRHKAPGHGGNQTGFTTISEKCPCSPAGACNLLSPTYKPEAAEQFYAVVVPDLAFAPQSEARLRTALFRSHPKRGPPAPLA